MPFLIPYNSAFAEWGVSDNMRIKLTKPDVEEGLSFTRTLNKRKSCRSFLSKPLNLKIISQLLWAAGGIRVGDVTSISRTTPSAGATYPLEIFLVAGEGSVENTDAGVYVYLWQEHKLDRLQDKDIRKDLGKVCSGQMFIAEAPASLIIAAEYQRTTFRYGERGVRYVHMEVGSVCQNIHLQAESLELGTVIIGAFYDTKVKKVLDLPDKLAPIAIMPVGYKGVKS